MSDDTKETILRKLDETRDRTLRLARELDQDDWTHPVYTHDGDWTALDLLRHMTWAESGMLRLMKMIRDGAEGVPPDFDIDRYNASGVRKLSDKLPAELMALMEENRRELLQFIDKLEEDDWQKEGRHGSLRVMTIEQILYLIAAHEDQHRSDLRTALELGLDS